MLQFSFYIYFIMKKVQWLLGAFFILITISTLYLVLIKQDVGVYGENGIIENFQAGLLAVTGFIFLIPLILKQARGDKLVLIFLSYLCFGFFLREVDVEYLDVPEILITLGSGKGRNIILAICFFSILGYALLHFRYYLDVAKKFFQSTAGKVVLTAFAVLIIGEQFEDLEDLPHHVFIEELFELVSFFLLTSCAFLMWDNSKNHPNPIHT